MGYSTRVVRALSAAVAGWTLRNQAAGHDDQLFLRSSGLKVWTENHKNMTPARPTQKVAASQA